MFQTKVLRMQKELLKRVFITKHTTAKYLLKRCPGTKGSYGYIGIENVLSIIELKLNAKINHRVYLHNLCSNVSRVL